MRSRRNFLILLALACFFSGSFPYAIAAPPTKTLLILGDSLAAGYGVDLEQAWPALLQKKAEAAGLGWKIINAGVSGDTSADGLQRVDWLLHQPVDALLLELGGNDGLRGLPVKEMKKNLQGIIDAVKKKYPGCKIIIAGMKMPPSLGLDYVADFDQVYPDLSAKNHATLIPFLLTGVAARADLNQADGIHPTPAGHQIVADNIWPTVNRVLTGP